MRSPSTRSLQAVEAVALEVPDSDSEDSDDGTLTDAYDDDDRQAELEATNAALESANQALQSEARDARRQAQLELMALDPTYTFDEED